MTDVTAQDQQDESTHETKFAHVSRGYYPTIVALFTAPIGFTLWLSWNVLVFVDDKVKLLVPDSYVTQYATYYKIPGFGLVALVIGLTLIGMLAA